MHSLQMVLEVGTLGVLYAIMALGFSLTYTLGRFFDLSQGAAFLVGAYAGFVSFRVWGWGLVASPVFSGLAGAGLGVTAFFAIVRPLRVRSASTLVFFLATLGFLIFVQSILSLIFGSEIKVFQMAESDTPDLGPARVTTAQLGELITGILLLASVAPFVRFSRWGRRLRAISSSETLAAITGIPVSQVFILTFALAGFISGIAGFWYAFERTLEPGRGLVAVLAAIIASVVGGSGRISGAILGAFLLAILETLAVTILPGAWKHTVVYALLILFLLIRPQGLLGAADRTA